MRIYEADLKWWLDIAGSSPWTFAKTFADTAPHSYVVLGHTPVLTKDDYERAARVIATFGQPGWYYNHPRIYLWHEGTRYWYCDTSFEKQNLINKATDNLTYGENKAPVTETGKFTERDAVATSWDSVRNTSLDADFRQHIFEHFSNYAPRTLDIGCATGTVLDLGITSPKIYTAMDSSRAMLNMLYMKYPSVSHVIPGTLDASLRLLEPPYDLIVARDTPEATPDMLMPLIATDGHLVIFGGSDA